MKKIILFLLTVIAIPAIGQSQYIGMKLGMNLTNVSNSISNDNKNKPGILGGLTYEYQFNEHFSLGVDFNYDQRGYRSDFIFIDNSGNPTGEKTTMHDNYDYLSLPLKAGYHIGDKRYLFANIGVSPAILVNAKIISPLIIDGNVTDEMTLNNYSRATKIDLSGLIELGGGFKLKDRTWLYSSFSYQHSFTTITNSEYFAGSVQKHYGIALSVGIKYTLTK